MATTLDLGSYSNLTSKSVIGYDSDTDRFAVEKEGGLSKEYTQEYAISKSGSFWTLDGALSTDKGVEKFTDTNDRSWKLTVESGVDVELGSGKDSLSVALADNQEIQTGDGKDTVEVTSADGGVVDLGEGNDVVSVKGTVGEKGVSITGGAGKDSIDVSGLTSGTVTLTDFDATEDVLITNKGLGSVTSDGLIVNSDGTKAVQVNETNGYYLVNEKDAGLVAWATTDGSNIDLSSFTKTVTIYGDKNEAVDTLIGGSKGDSLYAGAGDYVYGGAGNDTIAIDSAAEEAVRVGLAAAGGKDTVASGFTSGTDVVYLFENSITEGVTLSKSGNDITVKQGKATLTLKSVVDTTDATKGQETVINIEDNSGTTYDVDFVDGTASVSAADSMHKVYYSNSSSNKLDFNKFDDSLVVDLGNTGIFTNTGDATYYGDFAKVTGGTDDTILMGAADNKETLVAGSGATTLWGGGKAADVLQGHGATSAENAVTYFYTTGDGKDSVTSANWGKEDEKDVLYFSNVQLSSIKKTGTTVTFTMADSSDKLTVSGVGDNSVVKFTNDGNEIKMAKIGTDGKSSTWSYDEDVDMYLGGKSNTLTVSDDADIWLDGSKGTSYQNVSKVSAKSSSGTVVIAGNGANDEVLEAGIGESSLWGGAGSSNDTLTGAGSNGSTTYYFGNGEGNDVITGTGSDDKVLLYNVAASDIASIDTATSGQMKFTLNDGSTLTIKGMSSSSVSEFELGDGSKWTYTASSKSWTQH